MCGLAGFFGGEIGAVSDDDLLRFMANALIHRGPDDGGYLIAHGFAAAGRHQYQRIPAADHVVNDCRLITAKFIKPENTAQNGARSWRCQASSL